MVANTLLSERTNQLTILQKDLEKRCSNQDTLDENYRKQKVFLRFPFIYALVLVTFLKQTVKDKAKEEFH